MLLAPIAPCPVVPLAFPASFCGGLHLVELVEAAQSEGLRGGFEGSSMGPWETTLQAALGRPTNRPGVS